MEKTHCTEFNFNYLVEYLKNKKVCFAVCENYLLNTKYIVGITVSKKGKFFTANKKIIACNMIKLLQSFSKM